MTCAPAAVLQAKAVPQPPQLLALVAVSTSQPLGRRVAQAGDGPDHTGLQPPLKQSLLTTCALPATLHTVPQALQLFSSVYVSASQPLGFLPSQLR